MSLDQAVRALRTGRWGRGRELLEVLLAEPQPPTVEGPLRGMLAQALLELDRCEEAKDELRHALRIAKALGDQKAIDQLRALNGRVYAQLAHEREQARLAQAQQAELQRPLDELLARASTPAERCTVLLGKANAELDLDLALRAREEAEHAGPREQVLARLCLARLQPRRAEAMLREAHRIADTHEEPQLVAAIAQAARAAGVDFATHLF